MRQNAENVPIKGRARTKSIGYFRELKADSAQRMTSETSV